MQVRVLGEVDVVEDGEPIAIRQHKLRQLVSVLALADGPLTSGRLQTMLWVEAETRNMMSALTNTVMRLRKVLPADRVVRDKDGYRLVLDAERDYLDVQEFRELISTARRVRETNPRRSAELLQQAVELWRDPTLPDSPDTPAVAGEIQLLQIERRDAIEALVEVQMALGRYAVVARQGPGWLADDPLNDQLWLALMLAYYRDGHKGAALQAFDAARSVFLTELGAEPSLPLQSMRDRIAANDPGLAWHRELTAQESRAINAGSDITLPSPARTYDYMLGGDNNFEVDRQAAQRILAVIPDVRHTAQRNRAFLRRVVRLLAQQGIRQFLDIGTGLPTQGSVHEVAREIVPDARVVYVDYDPTVVAHGKAMIDDSRNTAYIRGDIRSPAEIFANPETRRLMDLETPMGLLMLAILHFIPADDVHLLLEEYRARMAPGSAVAISHMTRTGSSPPVVQVMEEVATKSTVDRVYLRSRAEIESLFTGLELVAPLDDPGNWKADEALPACSLALLGSVAYLPH
jgi:DNA-binding SARP family transcriptional activator